MANRYPELSEELCKFIENQKIFFVGTATQDSRVNISPKGMDSLIVLDKNRVAWLNVTGSGNETAAHMQILNRMTLMFCAFDGNPLILRLYGHAQVIHPRCSQWEEMYSKFMPLPGARQIFDLNIDLVQTSCGMSVPLYNYIEEREQLNNWAIKKGTAGISEYWKEKNQYSLDGKPTNILGKHH